MGAAALFGRSIRGWMYFAAPELRPHVNVMTLTVNERCRVARRHCRSGGSVFAIRGARREARFTVDIAGLAG